MDADIDSIKQRNARVEADKAWEISLTRRAIIVIGTYIAVGLYLTYLEVDRAWLHALVPPMAYMLSTLGLGAVKAVWLKHLYKK